MDLFGTPVSLSMDVNQTTNAIYRREDGEIGLLEVKESCSICVKVGLVVTSFSIIDKLLITFKKSLFGSCVL